MATTIARWWPTAAVTTRSWVVLRIVSNHYPAVHQSETAIKLPNVVWKEQFLRNRVSSICIGLPFMSVFFDSTFLAVFQSDGSSSKSPRVTIERSQSPFLKLSPNNQSISAILLLERWFLLSVSLRVSSSRLVRQRCWYGIVNTLIIYGSAQTYTKILNGLIFDEPYGS